MVGIVSNSAALFAQRNLAVAASTSESSISRLSSGNAIVSAADDVAGLAIGTVLRTTVSTLKTILNSAAQASSLLGIADAGLQNIGEILQRQKSLAVQANTGSLSNNERAFLDQEFQNLVSEINRIVDNTKFNGIALLNGSISGTSGLTTATGAATEDYSIDAAGDFVAIGTLESTDVLEESPLAVVSAVAERGTKAVGSILFGSGTTNAAGTRYEQEVQFTVAGVNTDVFNFGNLTVTIATAPAAFNQISAALDVNEQADAIANVINQHSAAGSFVGGRTYTATTDGAGLLTVTANEIGAGNIVAATVGGGDTIAFSSATITEAGTAGSIITVGDDTYELAEAGATGTIAAGTEGLINITDDSDASATLAEIVEYLNTTGQTAGADTDQFVFSYDTSGGATLTATGKTYGAANFFAVIGANTFSANTAGVTVTALVENDTLDAVATPTYNTNLIGGLSNLQAQYVAGTRGPAGTLEANALIFTAVINGENYTSEKFYLFDTVAGNDYATNLGTQFGDNVTASLGAQFLDTGATQTAIRFFKSGQDTATDADSGISLTVSSAYTAVIADQSDATDLATDIQTQLDAASFAVGQKRNISSVDVASVGNTVLSGIEDTDISLSTAGFATDGTFGDIGSFTVNADADSITVTINDKVFTSDLTSATLGFTGGAGGSGNLYSAGDKLLEINTTQDGTLNNLIFVSEDGEKLTLNLDNLNAAQIDFTDDDGVTSFQTALNSLFDVSSGSAGALNFQVGTTASDSIGLSLNSAATTSIYVDDNDTAVTLSVATAEGAIEASDVLDNAINTVTSLRATVGALQSRFNFASANVNASIQNTEAARSIFLDVDIAEESTQFATAQVRLQASISVLAQANLIPQNLLKLIG